MRSASKARKVAVFSLSAGIDAGLWTMMAGPLFMFRRALT